MALLCLAAWLSRGAGVQFQYPIAGGYTYTHTYTAAFVSGVDQQHVLARVAVLLQVQTFDRLWRK